jgi:hypothetical protein
MRGKKHPRRRKLITGRRWIWSRPTPSAAISFVGSPRSGMGVYSEAPRWGRRSTTLVVRLCARPGDD